MSKPPNKDDILAWISANPLQSSGRDIAKAFGLKGSGRIELKRILKQLEDHGQYGESHKDQQIKQDIVDHLPPVSVLKVIELDENGDLFATPEDWAREGQPPRIFLVLRPAASPLGLGDYILARVVPVVDKEYQYEARPIRRIDKTQARVLGVYRLKGAIGKIVPIDKSGKEWRVVKENAHGAKDGELVEAVKSGSKSRMGLPQARIIKCLGNPSADRAISLILYTNTISQIYFPSRFWKRPD